MYDPRHQHAGGQPVLTTIIIGTCVSVQGIFVKRLANGWVSVRVGETLYTGRPVSASASAAA
jgi:hypothetical protein